MDQRLQGGQNVAKHPQKIIGLVGHCPRTCHLGSGFWDAAERLYRIGSMRGHRDRSESQHMQAQPFRRKFCVILLEEDFGLAPPSGLTGRATVLDVTVALRFTAVRSRISLTSILSCEYSAQFDVSMQIPCEKCANPMSLCANAQKSWTLLVPGRCKWRRRPVFPGHRAEIRNVRGNSRGHRRFRVHPDKWRWRIRRRRIQGAARVHRGRRDGEGDCGALSAE